MGQQFANVALKESGRPSMVVSLLGGTALAACVVMTCTGIYELISGTAEGEDILAYDAYSFECHE